MEESARIIQVARSSRSRSQEGGTRLVPAAPSTPTPELQKYEVAVPNVMAKVKEINAYNDSIRTSLKDVLQSCVPASSP